MFDDMLRGHFQEQANPYPFFFALFAWQVQKWCCGAVFVWQNSLRDKSPVALWLLLRSGRTPLPLLWKCTHVLNDYLLGICVLRFGGGTRVNVAQQNPFQRRKGQKNFFFVERGLLPLFAPVLKLHHPINSSKYIVHKNVHAVLRFSDPREHLFCDMLALQAG